MKTIDQIKAELRDIIELSDRLTPAPWLCVNPPLVKGCPQDERDENFVAASRDLTPKMARALLGVIEWLEVYCIPTSEAEGRLETIRREWEGQA